jgi:dolichyl-phosphate beta-glucosyltransferase
MPNTAIVVPCFNEEKRFDATAFLDYAGAHPTTRFILVDDGSTDSTRGTLERIVAARPWSFSMLPLERNSGKAEAVRRGFVAALEKNPDFVGFWDADLATPLAAIDELLSAAIERPAVDMVFGSRVKLMGRTIERRAARHYSGRVAATAISLALRLPIYDTQCGAKIFRGTSDLREVFATPFKSRWIFDVEIIARFLRKWRAAAIDPATKIHELPLRQWTDVADSKVRALDFFRAARDLFVIWMTWLR